MPIERNNENQTVTLDTVAKTELFGSDSRNLYMLNSELAARVYSAPSLVL